ncbi:MAG: PKD domain-containing protein, partial [Chitinophagales bacterium]
MKKYLFLFLFLNLSVIIYSQVNADFSMAPPNGCSPLSVSFTDASTGAVTNWDWTFGNGNTSTLQNPGAVFITPGNYPVCLTVTDGTLSDTFCDTVIVYEDPIINFIADDSIGCSDLTVNFTNLTITGTGIQSAFWNFGDGNTSNDINPNNTFTAGVYDITLIVTDNSGCIAQGDKLQYITATPAASADFSGTNTQSCGIPSTVNFTNTSANDAGATYTWIFGDGTPNSNLENPTHAYTAFGSYDVKLIVSKNGCTDSITKVNFVTIQAQDADFSANTTSSCIGESVSFTDLSILTPTAWSWDFGDGSAPSTDQNPSHAYNTAGTYTVTLSTTLTGCDDVETKTNYITVNANPTVNFSANQTDNCSTPFPVDFTSVTSPVVSYDWDFGDGSPVSNLANPTHIYTNAGIFSVSLSVTDANNCSASSNMPNLINIVPPVANFDIDSVLGCVPRTVNISDLSTSDNTITDWYWDFGDGNTQNGPQNPVHTYVDTGSFRITLAIADDNGCVDTLQPGAEVNVGQPLMPDFSATPLSACRIDPISFTNLTDSLGISGVQWSWDFGDGGIGTIFEPMYQYGDTGVFEVSLTATHNGCSRSISYPDLITINPPIAIFSTTTNCNDYTEISFIDNSIDPETWTWNIAGDTFNTQDVLNYNTTGMPSPLPVTLYVENNTFGCLDSLSLDFTPSLPVVAFEADDSLACAPFDVQFTNNSTFGASYVWDFGDGSTSSATNPSHTYSNNGIYTVKLVVQNTLGCSDSISYTNLITVIGSDPDFTSPDTAGCRVFTTSFVDLSTSVAGPITNWSWDFGDGSPVNNMQNPVHSFSEVGSFNISLTTTDSAGCVNTETKPLYITSTGPLPGFNNTALACVDTDINFNNTSTSLGGTITSFLWNFGDGNTSTLENPTHSYNNPGIYDVSLYLQDNNGCDSTFVVQNA